MLFKVHSNGSLVSIVSSVILRRLDKKPDRVEISEEQLVQATLRAEELATEVNRPLRVVGWYHSHPHITVWPSHVDLATQSMYQRMDSSFVGIIFAVFLTDQTTKAPSTLTQLPAILKEEEDESYNNEAGPNENDDIINKQHNAAVRTIAIGHIVDKMSRPMLEGLVARNTLNTVRLKALKRQHQEMMSKLENMSCNV
ncbi:hypothetical protein B5X24_HaOG204980 [Helicoverpa armigera]|nr:hypothetical protein B5X24_HaOG204980 [Helicoverpa armigera]